MLHDVETDRRTLLSGLAGALVLVGCGGSGGAEKDAGTPAEGGSPADASSIDAGGDDADACAACSGGSKTLVVDLSKHAALKKKGGSALITDASFSDPACGSNEIIVAQPTAGKFIALSAACTHQCCTVTFSGNGFSCPCHGSEYDLTGKVTRGPAREALTEIPVCSDGCGKLYLTIK